MHERDLTRFYDFRRGETGPRAFAAVADTKWIEQFEARLGQEPIGHLAVEVQGIHCSGCVWLIEELFRRRQGGLRIDCNPAMGQLQLVVERGFALRPWVEDLARAGYQVAAPSEASRKGRRSQADRLLIRAGVCVALAMNAMLFSAAMYFGLEQGPVYDLVRRLSFGLGALAFLVGAPVFMRSAVSALRRGVVHFDVPIALGMVLAFAASAATFWSGDGAGEFFDTIAVFIALMLVGRWLQVSAIESNRNRLLSDNGIERVLTRRVENEVVQLIPFGEVREGDVLLVAPLDVVPVDATLVDAQASLSLEWINGESELRTVSREEFVPAGACGGGNRAFRVQAASDFDRSPLRALLRHPTRADDQDAGWRGLSAVYVAAVLVASGGGLVGWWLSTSELSQGLQVAAAVLVVSCPCAFGIAMPLAYELVCSRLQRHGLFVRTQGFLERASNVRLLAFDKTGTLTTGRPRIVNPSQVDDLTEKERQVLYNLAARSGHPKSAAVRELLEGRGGRFEDDLNATEHAGLGVQARFEGATFRLGAPGWASPGGAASEADLVFARNECARAAFRVEEALRPRAAQEIRRLREAGFDIWILSGDRPDAVRAVAAQVGVSADRALGGLSPADKARWLVAHAHQPALFVGDGVNDAMAAEVAHCSATPTIDRPFMPSRCDFYFTTAGLEPIVEGLRNAKRFVQWSRAGFAFAAAYNAVAVGVALAGLMRPWLAAVVMPLSSLLLVGSTTLSLTPRRPVWRPAWMS